MKKYFHIVKKIYIGNILFIYVFSSLIGISEMLNLKDLLKKYLPSTDYLFLFIHVFDPQLQLTRCAHGTLHLTDVLSKGSHQLNFHFNKLNIVQCLRYYLILHSSFIPP